MTKKDPRNIPIFPAAMTPAELTRRRKRQALQAVQTAAAVLIVAAASVFILALCIIAATA